MTWNQRLFGARIRLHLSKSDAAKLIGVSRWTLSRWENGTTKPLPIFRNIIMMILKDNTIFEGDDWNDGSNISKIN